MCGRLAHSPEARLRSSSAVAAGSRRTSRVTVAATSSLGSSAGVTVDEVLQRHRDLTAIVAMPQAVRRRVPARLLPGTRELEVVAPVVDRPGAEPIEPLVGHHRL